MTKKIPIVNFGLLGEENYVTDFVQVHNPALKRVAAKFPADVDGAIKAVAAYVAGKLEYPLNYRGRPTGDRATKVFKFWNGFYLMDKDLDYGWLLPNQTLEVKKGICMDSSCLATSLLRIKGVEAFTVLGVVLRTRSKRILGFHAWTEAVMKNGLHVVMETTVHPKPAELVPAKKMYSGKLAVTFDPLAWFNESVYAEDEKKTKRYEEMLIA